MYDDTIAAIATPPGEGGISIVRLSGAEAPAIAERIFKLGKSLQAIKTSQLDSHRLYYGGIVEPTTGRQIDEVMLVRMQPPRTFTREEVVEISCHGGWLPVREVLSLCLSEGARLAEPGEFTLRAFLNGRIDLSQAEAVAGLVSARTNRSLDLAVNELRGQLTARLAPARGALIESLAYLDAAADFPDDEIPEHDLGPSLDLAQEQLTDLIASAETGLLYREGVRIAIVGQPNVGKSSLLNALIGSDRAIVTEIAGTTRDVIAESINLEGIPATVLDTAGITETEDIVERIGVERSRQALASSAIAVLVLDRSEPLREQDFEVAELLQDRLDGAGVLAVWNKIDLPSFNGAQLPGALQDIPTVEISTVSGVGLQDLTRALHDLAVSKSEDAAEPALVTARQLDALRRSLASVEAAIRARQDAIPLDLLAVDVREALYAIGEITGEQISEAVLDEIFSRFCIGK